MSQELHTCQNTGSSPEIWFFSSPSLCILRMRSTPLVSDRTHISSQSRQAKTSLYKHRQMEKGLVLEMIPHKKKACSGEQKTLPFYQIKLFLTKASFQKYKCQMDINSLQKTWAILN